MTGPEGRTTGQRGPEEARAEQIEHDGEHAGDKPGKPGRESSDAARRKRAQSGPFVLMVWFRAWPAPVLLTPSRPEVVSGLDCIDVFSGGGAKAESK